MKLNTKAIGRRIREARLAARISQAELAEKADVSPQYISLVENGKKQISLTVLACVAEALSVPVDRLLTDSFGGGRYSSDPELEALLTGCSRFERKVIMDVVLAAKRSLTENRLLLQHIV